MRTGGAQRLLITDSETRGVVAACRGLKAGGFAVTAVAGSRPAPAHWSRAPDRRVTLPHPLTDFDAFIDGLEALVRDEPHALAIPGRDGAPSAVSASRDRLEPHAR